MKKQIKKQVFSFQGDSERNIINESQNSISSNHQQSNKQINPFNYQILPQLPSLRFENKLLPNKIKAGIYRHNQPQLNINNYFFDQQNNNSNNKPMNSDNTELINQKIINADKQIQQNIRRRLELEKQLDRIKKLKKQTEQNKLFVQNLHNQGYKSLSKQQKQYVKRNQITYKIDKQIQNNNQRIMYSRPNPQIKARNKQKQQINQQIKILTGHNLQDIVKSAYKPKLGYTLDEFLSIQQQKEQQNKRQIFQKVKQKKAPLQLCTEPDLIKVQKLLNIVTFPQIPKQNLSQLQKKCKTLYAIHKPHSDIIYLNMVISFHLKNFSQVRQYFKEIVRFKKFDLKAFWLAAQTQYELQNYQLCLKFTQNCIQLLDDKFLPRFIYLKAKSYYQTASFTNSIVCYNQLIRIKPKISEYYLQRAILYDKLGYQKQCKSDYLMFAILKPQAKIYLQEKIMQEENDAKRKQLLQIYKKIV